MLHQGQSPQTHWQSGERETNNISDDNEDAENLCLQEDRKVLKVQGVRILSFINFLHPEVFVSVFQIKRSVKIIAFLNNSKVCY